MLAKLRKPKQPPKPVEVEELREAILRTIVEKFGDRPLSWETVEEALKAVNYEAKMASLRDGPAQSRGRGRGLKGQRSQRSAAASIRDAKAIASRACSSNRWASSPVSRLASSWNAWACRRSNWAAVRASSTSANSNGTGRLIADPSRPSAPAHLAELPCRRHAGRWSAV
jgi:hypothetical protein